MVCTENMFREHVPAGTVPRTSVNARLVLYNIDILPQKKNIFVNLALREYEVGRCKKKNLLGMSKVILVYGT